MQTTQRKTIAFTSSVLKRAQRRAKCMGVSFTEYIRFITLTDLDKWESMPTYTLSDESERMYWLAHKEAKEGKSKDFDDVDKLMEYITTEQE
jgi:antitoxin component of RelBE/YafQ-DinJ toxin-antitoxin module